MAIKAPDGAKNLNCSLNYRCSPGCIIEEETFFRGADLPGIIVKMASKEACASHSLSNPAALFW